MVSIRLTKLWTLRYMILSSGRNWIPRAGGGGGGGGDTQGSLQCQGIVQTHHTLEDTEDVQLTDLYSIYILHTRKGEVVN